MRLGPTVNQVVEAITPIYHGAVSKKKLIDTLNKNFGSSSLYFCGEKNISFLPQQFTISGWYSPSEDLRVINIVHAPKIKTIYIFDLYNFSFIISQTIKHETIHQRQTKYKYNESYKISLKDYRKKFKQSEAIYLADPEEIHAYAHDIALEILYYYPKKNPLYIIKNIDRTRKLWGFNYYKKTFKGLNWYQIKNALLKQTKKWLPHVNL